MTPFSFSNPFSSTLPSFSIASSASSYIFWYLFYALLFLLFYVFSSPFTSSRELRHRWSGYVYVSTVLYVWLSVAVAFHLPILHYDTTIPISLFSPLFLASLLTLLTCEGLVKLLNRWFVYHLGFRQNSLEVFQISVIVSIIGCVVYTQCGTSSSNILARVYDHSDGDAIDVTVNAMCAILFSGHTNSHSKDLPTVLVLWSTAMSMIIINFTFERLAGFRGLFADGKHRATRPHVVRQVTRMHDSAPSLSSRASDESVVLPSTTDTANTKTTSFETQSPAPRSLRSSYLESLPQRLQQSLLQPTMLDMVGWYEMAATSTAVDMLIHLKLFLGRFDMRSLQSVMPLAAQSHVHNQHSNDLRNSLRFNYSHSHSDTPFVYDHLANDEDLWFDWMSDCGDGFNPSYQVARMLAQPSLRVNVKRRLSKTMGVMELPRAKVLFLGGDLAYPAPNQQTYEERFFNTFQCAMPPPSQYRPEHISIAKPACDNGMAGLQQYAGPQLFAIPGNHDWFDGLQTYLRYICGRDYCGGWLMPQEKSYFALKLNHGWWCLALDNALANDIDVNQFQYFARLTSMMHDDDRVLLMYHEPDWVIRAHEKIEIGTNIQTLQNLLNGRVVLKIAGDLHHYTRHMPVIQPSPTQANSDRPSFNVPGMPSEVDEWRWWNPVSWLQSFLKGRRSYNSRVYMEDLLQDMAPDSSRAITLARTVSSPVLNESGERSHDGHKHSVSNSARSATFAAPLSAPHSQTVQHSPFTNTVSVTPVKMRSKGFNLVDSPPPSPHDQSHHASPAGADSRRIHIVTNTSPKSSHSGNRSDSRRRAVSVSSASSNHCHRSMPSQTNPLWDVNTIAQTEQLLSIPMIDWSVSDVSAWLSVIGCSDLVAPFVHHEVDGQLLLRLDDDDLAAELNVASRLRRKKFAADRSRWLDTLHHRHNQYQREEKKEADDMVESNGSATVSLPSPHKLTPPSIKRTLTTESPNTDDNVSNDIHSNGTGNNGRSVSALGYERLAASPDHTQRQPPICIVSGGGGAFLHGTHVPSSAPIDVNGDIYVRTVSYPSLSTSRSYALLNIFGFRKRNFHFDLMGGCAYFLLVSSVLPLCHLDPIISGETWLDCLYRFLRTILFIHIKMAEESWLSLAVFLIAWFGCIQLAEESWPMYKRVIIGTLHCLAHSVAAFGALVMLETFVEFGLQRGLLGKEESVLLNFTKAFQFTEPIIDTIDSYTFHSASTAIDFLSLIFDVPEAIAGLKTKMCAAYPSHTAALFLNSDAGTKYKPPDVESIHSARTAMSRYSVLAYYVSTGLYLWVLATSLVSFVLGSYLYLMSAFFNAHATPAFSSLRVEGYKNFVRFHLTKSGDLELFVLGMDRCPRKWELDPLWSGYTESAQTPSHQWKVPSALKPARGEPDGIRIVDYLLIRKEDPHEHHSPPPARQPAMSH